MVLQPLKTLHLKSHSKYIRGIGRLGYNFQRADNQNRKFHFLKDYFPNQQNLMQRGKVYFPGYLTVYLALTMTVILSLCLALIEGVRSNAIRAETECVTEIGLNSILAEYHRELFRQYNLFAIDSSYGTALSGVEEVTSHLQGYMERNFSTEDIFLSEYLYKDFLAISVEELEMTGALLLTDDGGAVFRRKAVEAVQDDCNLTLLQDLLQWMQVIEDNGLAERNIAEEKQAVDDQIEKYNGKKIQISEEEWTTVEVQNPTEELEQIRKTGILKYVVEDEDVLSEKKIFQDNLIVSRMNRQQVNQGNIEVEDISEAEQLMERFFFQEYLLRYLGYYGEEKENGALSYQVEYLLGNNDSDIANLKYVVNIICAVREAANVAYLFSDEEKCGQAEVVATVIAALLQVPELAAPLKTAILFGWAFAESLHDVEVLLSGGKIPLLKDRKSWHYGLENALRLGGDEQSDVATGLSYKDYLRVMMMFADIDTLTGRAMNIVEADVRRTPGNAHFRLDNCYVQVEFCICVKSKYGYEYEITRGKKY